MSFPLVSYIVPCYNNVQFISECLESIDRQRIIYPNIEIIFVDDGSTDGSYDCAEKIISSKKLGIALKLPMHMGVGHALNVGFAAASGEYLCFFAADDILLNAEKTYYQQLIMESNGADISYYNDWYEGTSVSNMKLTSGKWSFNFLPIGFILKHFLYHSNKLFYFYLMHHNPINSGSLMIRKEAYKKYGEWNETVLTTDYDLLLRYCKSGAKFCPIKGASVFYRIHKGQSSCLTDEMNLGRDTTRIYNR